jgi:hypothetical protein
METKHESPCMCTSDHLPEEADGSGIDHPARNAVAQIDRLLGPKYRDGRMRGDRPLSCHTRLPFLNNVGSKVQPSVITHSLTRYKHIYVQYPSIHPRPRPIHTLVMNDMLACLLHKVTLTVLVVSDCFLGWLWREPGIETNWVAYVITHV